MAPDYVAWAWVAWWEIIRRSELSGLGWPGSGLVISSDFSIIFRNVRKENGATKMENAGSD